MTDRIHSARAVSTPIDCDRFDDLLADWLEGTLPPIPRAEAEAHRLSCARCRALADDLVAIGRDAAALPPLQPERDLWAGIAARIEAPVVPLGRTGEHASPGASPGGPATPLRVERGTIRRDGAHRFHVTKRWLAAAAGVLVAVSVGSTYGVMRLAGRDGGSQVVATSSPAATAASMPTPDSSRAATPAPTAVAAIATPDTGRGAAQQGATQRMVQARRNEARLAADEGDTYGPVVTTYDREISSLRAALRHRTDLDSATVRVLEQSLHVIDDAIAQSRRALAKDPNSRLLGDQLTRALDQKVELLRTAVLLPSRS